MAAGVGKTYAMLEEGQERRRDGEDVVIGWLEPHGRAETAAMAEGLEVVPPLVVEHRGVPLRDMDTAAVIARAPRGRAGRRAGAHERPGHAPTPSATRTSRTLLDAGIDVISTVNVQHLESLNDRVLRADRRAGARDDPRPGAARRRRRRPGRPHPRGAPGAPARGQGLPRRARRGGAAQLLHRPPTSARCARSPCARWRARSTSSIHRAAPAPGARRPARRIAERVMVIARPERGAQRLVRHGVAGGPAARRRARRGVPRGPPRRGGARASAT